MSDTNWTPEAVTREVEEQLITLLGRDAGSSIDRNKHFKAMGLDSLLSIDLLATLEGSFGPLPETAIEQYPTVAKLSLYVYETKAPTSD